MKKILVSFLIAMFAVASVAFSAEIDNLPWNQSNIKTLRALPKDAVFQFFIRQYDPDNEMEWTEENIEWDSEWYPAGEGKYQLAVNHQSGPDIGYVTIYWQDAPGKFRSQSFDGAGSAGMQWYEGGPQFADLSGGGTTELIQLDRVGRVSRRRTKFIPDGEWPQVYRLRDGKYVEASRDFPGFYEKQILPMLDRAITQTRKDVATPKPSPVPGIYDGSQNDQQSERYLAALIMARDKNSASNRSRSDRGLGPGTAVDSQFGSSPGGRRQSSAGGHWGTSRGCSRGDARARARLATLW